MWERRIRRHSKCGQKLRKEELRGMWTFFRLVSESTNKEVLPFRRRIGDVFRNRRETAVGPSESMSARQHLVGNDGNAPDVACFASALPMQSLRSDVTRGSNQFPGAGCSRERQSSLIRIDQRRDSKVQHLRNDASLLLGQKHILRLQIAMNNRSLVRGLDRRTDTSKNLCNAGNT